MRRVASGNHCKTLETTVETIAWQPLGLVTSRVNQRGNHWQGSHQARVRGCEPEVRTSARTCYRYAPECVPTVRTELRTCCAQFAQFAQLLRIPVASRRWRWRWGAYIPPGHHAAQCVNMLREGCVKPCRGRASRIDQVREGRARRTARNTQPGTGHQPSVGLFCKLVTDGGHHPGSGVDQRQTVDTRVDTSEAAKQTIWSE